VHFDRGGQASQTQNWRLRPESGPVCSGSKRGEWGEVAHAMLARLLLRRISTINLAPGSSRWCKGNNSCNLHRTWGIAIHINLHCNLSNSLRSQDSALRSAQLSPVLNATLTTFPTAFLTNTVMSQACHLRSWATKCRCQASEALNSYAASWLPANRRWRMQKSSVLLIWRLFDWFPA